MVTNTKKINIICLGTPDPPREFEHQNFFNQIHFLDFDIVVVDPFWGSLVATRDGSYDYRSVFVENSKLSFGNNPSTAKHFLKQFDEAMAKLTTYLKVGKTAILYAYDLPIVTYIERNILITVDLNSKMPWGENSMVKGSGTKIEFAPGPFKAFFDESKDYWAYNCIYKTVPKNGVITGYAAGHKEHVIGMAYTPFEKGSFLITPCLLKEGWTTALINKLPLTAIDIKNPIKLPEWANKVFLPGEKEKQKSVQQAEDLIIQAKTDLIDKQVALKSLQDKKILFTGKDTSLEDMVREVLLEIGFDKVESGPTGRTDFIAEYKGRLLAIEIQGRDTKGIKEDHARALLAWVGEVSKERNQDVEGLLVGNPGANMELSQRNSIDPWPGRVLDVCQNYGFCAILGTQLLGIYIQCITSPESKTALIESLFSSVGAYPNYTDPREFLEIEETSAKSQI